MQVWIEVSSLLTNLSTTLEYSQCSSGGKMATIAPNLYGTPTDSDFGKPPFTKVFVPYSIT